MNGARSTNGGDASPRRQWKWQLALVVLCLAIVYPPVVKRMPLRVRNVLFVVGMFLPMVLNVAAWRLFRRSSSSDGWERWRRVSARVGLLANSVAIAIPWVLFPLLSYSLSRHWRVGDMIDGGDVLVGVLGLSLISLVAGAVAAGWVRVILVLNSLVVVCFMLSIPAAIL